MQFVQRPDLAQRDAKQKIKILKEGNKKSSNGQGIVLLPSLLGNPKRKTM